MSTYAERQAYRDSHPGAIVDNNSSSDGGFSSSTANGTSSGGGGGGGGGSSSSQPPASSGGDGSYQTKNGTQTVASMAQQLQAAGWQGNPADPAAVASAYQSTTGGTVTANAAAPAGGGGGGGGAPPAVVGLGGLTPAEQAQVDAFKASSGFSIQDLAERKRQFDANLAWQQQMWAQQGLPTLVIAQKSQALAEAEFAAQNDLAKQNLTLAQKTQSDANAIAQGNLGVSMGAQGLDYLKTAASMGGPADYFQEDNFVRGAQQRSDVPLFLQALQKNTQLGGGAATGTPTVQSAGGLASNLTGVTTGGVNATGTNVDAALSATGDVLSKGGGAVGPQGIEQLNPDEMNLLSSGAKALGYSMPAFLSQYQQSRIGQSAAQAA